MSTNKTEFYGELDKQTLSMGSLRGASPLSKKSLPLPLEGKGNKGIG